MERDRSKRGKDGREYHVLRMEPTYYIDSDKNQLKIKTIRC